MSFGAAGGRETGEMGSNGPARASKAGEQLHPLTAKRESPSAHNFGSQQLRIFRRARRDGASTEAAADTASMSIGEARLHAADDDKNPPPPEAFELLPIHDAPAAASPATKEDEMARGRTARKEPEDNGGVIPEKDFARAVKFYREDIKPAQSKVGEYAQEQSTAFKAIKKQCHIQPQAAKLAFKLDDMEEAKRDDFIRCFTGLCNELNIPLQSNDLVDQAEGKAPTPAPSKPKLVTVPKAEKSPPPADDSDLLGDAPQSGTSAAAIAAMRADHAKDKAEEDFNKPEPRNPPEDA